MDGANDWLLSTYVNLLAAGLDAAVAKAFVLTMVPYDEESQGSVDAIIDDQATDCAAMAAQALDVRLPADGWFYVVESPMQTYAVLPGG